MNLLRHLWRNVIVPAFCFFVLFLFAIGVL